MTDPVPACLPETAPDGATASAVIVTREERTVRLGDCGVAPENLRHGEPPDDDVPALAATIKAAGQLQRLTVRPGRRRERPWMALDGRRRLLALRLLQDAGDIDDDYPVTVCVETDTARQAAAALLTNTAVPLHVADVIAAIGRMLKARLTVGAIAKALGYAEIEIRRLAALAALPAPALSALRSGQMSLKQARLLARLPNAAEQAEIAETVADGYGFQEWRVLERLKGAHVTVSDRRCALVDLDAYTRAGGRTEADLFGEMATRLLDPDILSGLWLDRVRGVAAVFEAEGLEVHVTAGAPAALPDALEPLGYVYGGRLPPDELSRYRSERDAYAERAERVPELIAAAAPPDIVDLAMVDMIQAELAAARTGFGGRPVTALVLSPSAGLVVEVQCYAPTATIAEGEEVAPSADSNEASQVYVEPQVAGVTFDTDAASHALHAVRTDVATRGLIRALADDPPAAMTALIARLFAVLILGVRTACSEAALAIRVAGYAPAGGQVIDSLDGEVRRRLEVRREVFEASGQTIIAWVHALPPDERAALLAELTAITLDLQETRTTSVRRGARAEATELAALCSADITRHWTPDAAYLRPHAKGGLIRMLADMGAVDPAAALLKKGDLMDRVARQAADRRWAPAYLSWKAGPDDGASGPGGTGAIDPVEAGVSALNERPGALEVTPAGKAALAAAGA